MYTVPILSGTAAADPGRWLRERGFRVSAETEAALRSSLRSSLVVARVNLAGLPRGARGEAVLPLLRLSFESVDVPLPIALWRQGDLGAQDLFVYLLHPYQRFEVANQADRRAPSGLEVEPVVTEDFAAFYGQVFEETRRQARAAAVVTEFVAPLPLPMDWSESDARTLGHGEAGRSAGRAPLTQVLPGRVQVVGAAA